MKACCKEAEITGTPTFFNKGKRLSETYKIDELKYILSKYFLQKKGEAENLYRVGKNFKIKLYTNGKEKISRHQKDAG